MRCAWPVITSHHNNDNARSARGLKSWSVQSFLAEYPDGDRKRTRPTSVTAASPLGESGEGSGKSHVLVVFSAPSCCSYHVVRHEPQLSSARSHAASGFQRLLDPEQSLKL